MSDLAKLVDWLQRIETIAMSVDSWRAKCLRPYTNRIALQEFEAIVGQNVIEVLGRPS